jgi:hypothetical protein
MLVQIGEPQGLGVDDEQAQDPVALGELTDPLEGRRIHPHGDELRQAGPCVVEHPERTVAGVDETHRCLNDPAQHAWRIEVGAEDQHRVEQRSQARGTGYFRHSPHPTRVRRFVRWRPGTLAT